MICAAVVSGQQTGAAMAQWVGEHATEWQAWTPTARGRIPSPATVRRALRQVDAAEIEAALGDWVEALLGGDDAEAGGLHAVAIDGKAARGAQTHGAKAHLVSVVTHAQALTLAQCAVAAKSQEIPAVQRLLRGCDLRGWVVTLDAMRTSARPLTSLCARVAGI